MPKKVKGGYIPTSMTDEQIKEASNENIKIKNNDILTIYEKKGYAIDDRKKIFNNYIKNKTQKTFSHAPGRKKTNENFTYKAELPKIIIDDIINEVNGGCSRLAYY